MAFSDERCLPAAVRGPVECLELARLMDARLVVGWSSLAVAVADMLVPRFGNSIRLGLGGFGFLEVVEGVGDFVIRGA
jgi:hypothetical protein